MDRCDVLIVGGGPAGSSCAWRLAQAGREVAVLDKAAFPRDKVCAGWITPAVVRALDLDLRAYAQGRTLQSFRAFRTGAFDGELLRTEFAGTISYGIRRCEFDTYLLNRTGARVLTHQPLADLRREDNEWVVNGAIRAPVVVGAGGHFCPLARRLNGNSKSESVVVAQEVEIHLDADEGSRCNIDGESPALFFWPDLRGYGWCVRKNDHLNIGAGRLAASEFPAAMRQFESMLQRRGLMGTRLPIKWKGHAYLLNSTSPRRLFDDGMLLVGDAAGLALGPSGEGILSAVESGLLAADTILAADGQYSRERLARYAALVEVRFGRRRATGTSPPLLPAWVTWLAGRAVLNSRWLTRRVLLEEWFLHVRRPILA